MMAELDLAAGSVGERVAGLVRPILADLDVELYDLEHVGGTIRVTVTKPDGLDLEVIALITRLLSRELDHADPVPGKYTLEVTSPGLERTLRRPAHYRGALGTTVALRLTPGDDGLRRVQGTLMSADDDGITIRLDDDEIEHSFGYGRIDRARTVFDWGPAPKPGKAPPRTRRKASPTAADTTTSMTTGTTREVGES